jgi:hypothetical protein
MSFFNAPAAKRRRGSLRKRYIARAARLAIQPVDGLFVGG